MDELEDLLGANPRGTHHRQCGRHDGCGSFFFLKRETTETTKKYEPNSLYIRLLPLPFIKVLRRLLPPPTLFFFLFIKIYTHTHTRDNRREKKLGVQFLVVVWSIPSSSSLCGLFISACLSKAERLLKWRQETRAADLRAGRTIYTLTAPTKEIISISFF